MTKRMRAVLGSMTAKELKRHISRTNIKRYTRMGKKALIELMVKYKGRFKHLNPDEKIIKTDEKGKPKVKLPEPKYGTDKTRVFKRRIPTPSNSVQMATNTPDWTLARDKKGVETKVGIRRSLKGYVKLMKTAKNVKGQIAQLERRKAQGHKLIAPRTSGHGSTWGIAPQSPGLMMA